MTYNYKYCEELINNKLMQEIIDHLKGGNFDNEEFIDIT